jgi:hypothetical protein
MLLQEVYRPVGNHVREVAVAPHGPVILTFG